QGDSAQYTRQNANGDRHGYEYVTPPIRNPTHRSLRPSVLPSTRLTLHDCRAPPRCVMCVVRCPEERDYYPYWAPTPWRDIAILTNDITRCPAYLSESQNTKSRFSCRSE